MNRHTLTAFNTAKFSDNKIHDDGVAGKLGFTGGLVPGVEVFAYMAHLPCARWGTDFLNGGRLSAKFIKPVFDGDETSVTDQHGTLSVSTPSTELCATGAMELSKRAPLMLPRAERCHPKDRPDASAESLPEGLVLGTMDELFVREECRWYLDAVSEDLPLFRDAGPAHPGFLLRRANFVLAYSVKLGPWIHVASDVVFHSPLADGEPFETRGQVTRNYEHKGHLIVDLDVAITSAGRAVMSGTHSAIYRPRQLS